MNQVGIVKDNEFTRLANTVSELNRGSGKGRITGVEYIKAEPPARVRTAAMNTVADLPQEEKDRLDRLAAAYGVEPDLVPSPPDRQTAREFIGVARTRQPFLPDFTKIQAIDLEKNVVVVDGVEFAFDLKDREALLQFCLDTVTTAVTKEVAKALATYNLLGSVNGQTREDEVVQSNTSPQGEGTNAGQSEDTPEESSTEA